MVKKVWEWLKNLRVKKQEKPAEACSEIGCDEPVSYKTRRALLIMKEFQKKKEYSKKS